MTKPRESIVLPQTPRVFSKWHAPHLRSINRSLPQQLLHSIQAWVLGDCSRSNKSLLTMTLKVGQCHWTPSKVHQSYLYVSHPNMRFEPRVLRVFFMIILNRTHSTNHNILTTQGSHLSVTTIISTQGIHLSVTTIISTQGSHLSVMAIISTQGSHLSVTTIISTQGSHLSVHHDHNINSRKSVVRHNHNINSR